MTTHHPEQDAIRLESVLAALASPLRLAALQMIAEGGEHPCCDVLPSVGKSTMTHHFRVLRDSGVVWQRRIGQEYRLSIRRDDLDARFPGLLDSVLGPLKSDARTIASLAEYRAA